MTTETKSITALLGVKRLRAPRIGGDWPDPRCFIGLEVEAEGIRAGPPGKPKVRLNEMEGGDWQSVARNLRDAGWSIEADASLRGDGKEFKFSEPLLGEDLTSALDGFFSNVEFDEQPRAGTHIHVDWTDIDDADSVSRMMALLYCYEPAIFAIAGEGRKECVFCKPLTAVPTNYLVSMFTDTFGSSVKTYLDGAIARNKEDFRYFGVNLVSLSRFGSVELRYFPSVCDRAKLETWIRIAQLLRLCAVNCGLSPVQILTELSTLEGLSAFTKKWFTGAHDIANLLEVSMDRAAVVESNRVMAALCACEIGKGSTRTTYSPAVLRMIRENHPDAYRTLGEQQAYRTTMYDEPTAVPAAPRPRARTARAPNPAV